MPRDPKATHHVTSLCPSHVVWSPKDRRPVLEGAVRRDLLRILHEISRERHAELLEVEGTPDHVHLLVDVDPQYGVHRLIKQMKGRSSRFLRATHQSLRSRLPTLWTNRDFVYTTGGAPLGVITRYSEQQRHV